MLKIAAESFVAESGPGDELVHALRMLIPCTDHFSQSCCDNCTRNGNWEGLTIWVFGQECLEVKGECREFP